MMRDAVRVVSLLAGILFSLGTHECIPAEPNPLRLVKLDHRDGRAISAVLAGLEKGTLTLEGTDPTRIPTKLLIRLQYPNRKAEPGAAEPLVLLTDNCQLSVRAVSTSDESLTVRWSRFPVWNEFQIPLETIRGIVFNRPETPEADARLYRQLAGHRERHDLLILTNGDTLTGEFVALDENRISLQTASGRSDVERSGVRAIAFNSSLTNIEKLEGEGALLTLTDGSYFRIRELRSAPLERLECQLLSGGNFAFPTLSIVSLRFLGGCATYLSDLEPVSYRFTPYLNLEWPLERDRNVRGGPMRLRGEWWPKGLGTHSRCEVTYKLDGQYRRFQTTLGIDDDTQGKGSARFEVIVDGKSAFASDEITGTSPPLSLEKINVSGAKRLTLRVDYGLMGDIQDHADWCDAMLVK